MSTGQLPNAHYRQLIEHMNEAVWVGDRKERTVYANPKFCELMGYSLKEMLGRESYAFWDEESAKKVRHVNEQERTRGKSSSFEGKLRTKSGERIPVLLSGTPLPDGGTIGIMTDLRELKKKQEAAMLLEHAVKSASEAIMLIGQDGTIASWNSGARAIFGYQPKAIVKKPLTTLFPKWDGAMELLKKNGVSMELPARHQRGTALTIALSLSPLPVNAQGLGFLLLARDITAQRRFEEELSLKYQKLTDAYNEFGIIRRQMDYLFDLATLCGEDHDDQTLSDYIVSSLVMLSRVDGCVLRVYNINKKTLDLASSFGMGVDSPLERQMPLAGSIQERSFKEGRPLKILDLMQEPLFTYKEEAKTEGFTSALVSALTFKGELVGSVSLYVGPEKKLELFENRFLEKYMKFLAIILTQAVRPSAKRK